MSDEHSTPRAPDGDAAERRRDHLRLVRVEPMVPGPMEPVVGADVIAPVRPRSIGRLIAQTAMIADSAVQRRRADRPEDAARGRSGRLLGRFR